MPVNSNNMLGLIIFSLGILGVIISFLITDRKRYILAMALSGLVVLLGLFQTIQLSVRQWRTTRRITQLQEQQRLNLQALQDRLRQTQGQGNGSGNTQKQPAVSTPAGKK